MQQKPEPHREATDISNNPANAGLSRRVDVDALRGSHGAQTQEADLPICIDVKNLNLFYSEKQALRDINLVIPEKRVTAFIGPSGCGKSTLLRCFNRMNDLIDNVRIDGEVNLQGENIFDASINIATLRRRVGMVFQKPNPFPKSIYENVAYGLRIQGIKARRVLDKAVERSLRRAALWDEVKDRVSAW